MALVGIKVLDALSSLSAAKSTNPKAGLALELWRKVAWTMPKCVTFDPKDAFCLLD